MNMPRKAILDYESIELTEFRLAFEVSCDNEDAVPCERRRAELEAVSSCCLVCLCINLLIVNKEESRQWYMVLTLRTLTWHCPNDPVHIDCSLAGPTWWDRNIRERTSLIEEERQSP
jgi:hypothetical protein